MSVTQYKRNNEFSRTLFKFIILYRIYRIISDKDEAEKDIISLGDFDSYSSDDDDDSLADWINSCHPVVPALSELSSAKTNSDISTNSSVFLLSSFFSPISSYVPNLFPNLRTQTVPRVLS